MADPDDGRPWLFLGLDPGAGGGIAVLDRHGIVITSSKMPDTDHDILGMVTMYAHRSRAVLELVRSSPAMGVVSAFTFGRGYGGLRMALAACAVPYDEVVPQKWQRALGCLSGGDKNVTKGRAQELFPSVKITHATADALLLAEYCRRMHGGGG